MLSELSKYRGNASIGKSLLQKEKHRNICLANDRIGSLINSQDYNELEEIYTNVYEVSKRKQKVRHNIPLTLGCVVYSYSKLIMLQFIYIFQTYVY